MNLEQLALLGIGIFGFMALVTSFNAVRTMKRSAKQGGGGRLRRLIASPDVANSVAKSVVSEVRDKLEEEVEASRKSGTATPELEKALEEAKSYYLSRVESRYRTLFSKAVSSIIFARDDSEQ